VRRPNNLIYLVATYAVCAWALSRSTPGFEPAPLHYVEAAGLTFLIAVPVSAAQQWFRGRIHHAVTLGVAVALTYVLW
jgi:hypothetical protein